MYSYNGGLDLLLNDLTIVIPVKEKVLFDEFIEQVRALKENNWIIVFDSGGGEKLRSIAHLYITGAIPFWTARINGAKMAKTIYLLNLDANTILPDGYLEGAMRRLEKEKNVVVALDYEDCQGHLGMGTSLWLTKIFRLLYDWKMNGGTNLGYCECTYMWNKVRRAGFKVETLYMRAKHLKEGEEKW